MRRWSVTESVSHPAKFGKCEKSADLEMNWEILSGATGRIHPLSPPVAMDTVVFVS